MESFIVAMNAVIPIMCYLAYGWMAKRTRILTDDLIHRMNQVTFKLFYPCMSFYNIYSANQDGVPSLRVMLFLPISVLITEAVLIAVVPRIVPENRLRGTIIQAIARSNYVLLGMPLAQSVLGPEASSVVAMTITVAVSTFNITGVLILELFNETPGHSLSPKSLLVNLLKNPMLQGCMVGLVFFFAGWKLPLCLDVPVKAFSSLTTPFALFLLGGTLKLASVRRNLKYLVPSLFVKMVVTTAFWVPVAHAMGIFKAELFCVFCAFAAPVATVSYPMAESMGGDGELAGQFVVISTVLSLLTLFGWIYLFNFIGWF